MFKKSFYSLRKSKHIFFHTFKLFKRKHSKLSKEIKDPIKNEFKELQKALLEKDQKKASMHACLLNDLAKTPLKKSFFEKYRDHFISIVIALAVAVVVRQMWFELYEIPTGSMRPTLKEKDRLIVSKAQFGVNIPLTTKHLLFDPKDVKRSGIVVFTGKDMDIQDVDTLYFYLFPGKKQYIKRLIGKPGDTLYFHGGKIYGLDRDLNDISSEYAQTHLSKINHVPYISFEGRVITPKISASRVSPTTIFYQMNQPVARLTLGSGGKIQGQMEPIPSAPKESKIKTYDELWGFKNYGMARILTKKEYLLSISTNENLPESSYYLEILHSPSLKGASMERDLYGRVRPTLSLQRSFIPLNASHLEAIFKNLYTARFHVNENGYASRYGYKKSSQSSNYLPKLEGVPAGTYEFYYGKAYQVLWQGITKELPLSHPIYKFSPQNTYFLFNLGIEFDLRFLHEGGYSQLMPSRYTFFEEGALCLMGAPIFESEDPFLKEYLRNEKLKTLTSSYSPFIPNKGPLKEDGTLDKEMILAYGLRVPEEHYLVLGDNYAMSADSRDFGFVPQNNLRGVPDFIFWPFGDRFGKPAQIEYPLFTQARLVIWSLAILTFSFYLLIEKRRKRLPIDFDEYN